MMDNNYQYSKDILHFCLDRSIPFLYASSAATYGGRTDNLLKIVSTNSHLTFMAIPNSCLISMCVKFCHKPIRKFVDSVISTFMVHVKAIRAAWPASLSI